MSKETVIKVVKYFIAVFLFVGNSFAQNAEHNITIVEERVSYDELINRIEKLTEYTFSYSPDDFEGKFVKVNIVDRDITYVLDLLFSKGFGYVKTGNDIIVFKTNEMLSEQESHIPEKIKEDIAPVIVSNVKPPRQVTQVDTIYKVSYDTLIVHDTVVVRDTVLQVNTIIQRDTVYQKRLTRRELRQQKAVSDTLSDSVNVVKYHLNFNISSLIVSTSIESDNNELEELYLNALNNNLSYEAGVEAGISKGSVFAESGLTIRKIRQGFTYTYNQPSGSYYQIDTIETYYVVADYDTTWHYITDSALTAIPGLQQSYNHNNAFTFLDVPIYLGYRIDAGNVDFVAKAGMIFGFMIQKEGYYIRDEELYPVGDLNQLNSRISMSGVAEFGVVYHPDQSNAWFVKLKMMQEFKSALEDVYPVKEQYSVVGIKLGYRYTF